MAALDEVLFYLTKKDVCIQGFNKVFEIFQISVDKQALQTFYVVQLKN